jgi:hypothetical protein
MTIGVATAREDWRRRVNGVENAIRGRSTHLKELETMTDFAKLEAVLQTSIGLETAVYADTELLHPAAVAFSADRPDEKYFLGLTKAPIFSTLAEDGDVSYRIERAKDMLVFVQVSSDADGYSCNVYGQAMLCDKGSEEEGTFLRAALKDIFTRLAEPVADALAELNKAAPQLGLTVNEIKPMLAEVLGL